MCIQRYTWSSSSPLRVATADRRLGFGQRWRALTGPYGNPELWLRACAIAALRQRDGVDMIDLLETPGAFGYGPLKLQRYALPSVEWSAGDERAIRSSSLVRPGSPVALASMAHRDFAPCEAATRTHQACGIGVGGSDARPNSCADRPSKPRRRSVMRSRRSIAKRLEKRSYLLAARWAVKAAHFLAMSGLLSRRGAFIAFRLSSRLSKKSWAIWRSERTFAEGKQGRRVPSTTKDA
jgi:hypothetical protein